MLVVVPQAAAASRGSGQSEALLEATSTVDRGRRRLGHRARRAAAEDPGARRRWSCRPRALADAIADEWHECGETIDPRAMPLTGLANAAIDRVAPDPRQLRRRPRALCRGRPRSAIAPKVRATLVARAGGRLGCAAGLGAAALRRRFRRHAPASSTSPQPPATVAAAGPCGGGARSVPARGPVAAGDDRRVAGRRAGGARGRDRPPKRRGRRSASTSAGRSSNGAPTPRRVAALDSAPRATSCAAARFLELLGG